jgi:hypothetical protein
VTFDLHFQGHSLSRNICPPQSVALTPLPRHYNYDSVNSIFRDVFTFLRFVFPCYYFAVMLVICIDNEMYVLYSPICMTCLRICRLVLFLNKHKCDLLLEACTCC